MLYEENSPRPEYPRPQAVRADWLNLNGTWEYETDRAESGCARALMKDEAVYRERITVPFCRESVLSGIGDKDFCSSVWYRKKLTLPEGWQKNGNRIIWHIGACDYETVAYVNGKQVGSHIGGYVSFSFEITEALREGENTLVLWVTDHLRTGNQPAGKQSISYASAGCNYTRTTGVWQTVWLECVPSAYIVETRYFPRLADQSIEVEIHTSGANGMTVEAAATYEELPMGKASGRVSNEKCTVRIPLKERHLWEVGHGRLYGLTLKMGEDLLTCYFGMREIGCENGILTVNGKRVFQRLVLDQGFYPDGIYTAPTAEALEADIDRSLAMGFNGARLHQKIFEPQFLSACDRKGYIVWGEDANWGLDIARKEAYEGFLPEWLEALRRDFNHPAIIGWCPLNETQINQNEHFVKILSDLTRAYDPTRLYIDASGWCHIAGCADLWDIHNYEQDPKKFKETFAPLLKGTPIDTRSPFCDRSFPCKVTFVSEYGGIWWASGDKPGWGYGKAPESEKAFLTRFRALTEVLLFHPTLGGLCYTQLTDVEQEVNGLYTYDRHPKFDPALFHAVLSQKAAVEE